MNSTYTSILTTIVRVAVMWLMGALASHLSPTVYNLVNNIITQIGGINALITAVAGALGLGLLSVWIRLKSKLHLKIALALPQGATVADMKNEADKESTFSVLTNPAK